MKEMGNEGSEVGSEPENKAIETKGTVSQDLLIMKSPVILRQPFQNCCEGVVKLWKTK